MVGSSFVADRFFTDNDVADPDLRLKAAGSSNRNELLDAPGDQFFHFGGDQRGPNSKVADGNGGVVCKVKEFREAPVALLIGHLFQDLFEKAALIAKNDGFWGRGRWKSTKLAPVVHHFRRGDQRRVLMFFAVLRKHPCLSLFKLLLILTAIFLKYS